MWMSLLFLSLRGPLCAGEAFSEARKKTWGPGRNSYLVPSPHIFFRLWARKRAAKVVGVPPIRGANVTSIKIMIRAATYMAVAVRKGHDQATRDTRAQAKNTTRPSRTHTAS